MVVLIPISQFLVLLVYRIQCLFISCVDVTRYLYLTVKAIIFISSSKLVRSLFLENQVLFYESLFIHTHGGG